MIKAIIFDLDNTLVDFMKMKRDSIDAAIEAMIDAGLDMPRGEIKSKIYNIYEAEGIEYQKIFDQFLTREMGGIDPKIHAAGIVAYRKARDAALVPYPHVDYTLIELAKRGIKMAVISDAPKLQAWLRLCQLKLHHLFDCVVTFEDTGELKPNPAPFLKALQSLEVEPSEALMVGDWPERDVVGAKRLGIRTVFARYGDTFDTTSSGADYEIDDIAKLLSLVDEENNR